MAKKKNKGSRHTPITAHKKEGSRLRTSLSQFNIQSIDWPKDFLPEHIWIAALAEDFGLGTFHKPYNAFLDALDTVFPSEDVALGMLSDFALIPEEKRQEFLHEYNDLVKELFYGTVGRSLALYPDNPAAWLSPSRLLEQDGPLDPEKELGYLRLLVRRLLPGKDDFAGRVRAVPLNRLLKHEKIFFAKGLPGVDLMPHYPIGLNKDERYLVETIARQSINQVLQDKVKRHNNAWPKYFWRHNFSIVACRPSDIPISGGRAVNVEQANTIQEILTTNAVMAREYLDLLRRQFKADLYDPTRDEVLFGLFGRVTRLFCLMCEDIFLWARDVAGIMLRCLADTAITFAYLATKGTDEEFRSFIEYGEGQQKLLMLHLQDNYPSDQSLEGLSAEDISDELGGFMPEILDIELGHWTKKDTRKLSLEVGMERLYRLVYSPASSDLHGSWLSLRNSNLTLCVEYLHRFHRMPTFAEPPFYVNSAITAQELYEECRNLAVDKLNYPPPSHTLQSLQAIEAGAEGSEPNT